MIWTWVVSRQVPCDRSYRLPGDLQENDPMPRSSRQAVVLVAVHEDLNGLVADQPGLDLHESARFIPQGDGAVHLERVAVLLEAAVEIVVRAAPGHRPGHGGVVPAAGETVMDAVRGRGRRD